MVEYDYVKIRRADVIDGISAGRHPVRALARLTPDLPCPAKAPW